MVDSFPLPLPPMLKRSYTEKLQTLRSQKIPSIPSLLYPFVHATFRYPTTYLPTSPSIQHPPPLITSISHFLPPGTPPTSWLTLHVPLASITARLIFTSLRDPLDAPGHMPMNRTEARFEGKHGIYATAEDVKAFNAIARLHLPGERKKVRSELWEEDWSRWRSIPLALLSPPCPSFRQEQLAITGHIHTRSAGSLTGLYVGRRLVTNFSSYHALRTSHRLPRNLPEFLGPSSAEPIYVRLIESASPDGRSIILKGEVPPKAAMAWHPFTFSGSISPASGLVTILRQPVFDASVEGSNSGLADVKFSGYVVDGGNMVGTWTHFDRERDMAVIGHPGWEGIWEGSFVWSRVAWDAAVDG